MYSEVLPLTNASGLSYDPEFVFVDPVTGVQLKELTPGNYSDDPQSIVVLNQILTTELLNVDWASTGSWGGSGGQVTFTVVINGTIYWHSGTGWEQSDGTIDQSNFSSEFNSNASTLFTDLGLTGPQLVEMRFTIISFAGDSTQKFSSLTVQYEFDNYQALAAYYANLLILEYHGKEKAAATVYANARMAIMDQLPVAVQNAFAVPTAIGVQLDTLGKYAGVVRRGNGPNGQIVLNDDDFRILIQIAIIQNNAGSSLATIQDLLNTYFSGKILVFDYADMRMSYYIDSSLGSLNLVYMFIINGLLPKPMGVQLASIIYGPVIDKFFGFRTYVLGPHNITPFNSYDDYDMDSPWLSYGNAIPKF